MLRSLSEREFVPVLERDGAAQSSRVSQSEADIHRLPPISVDGRGMAIYGVVRNMFQKVACRGARTLLVIANGAFRLSSAVKRVVGNGMRGW